MKDIKIKIADKIIEIKHKYEDLAALCTDYTVCNDSSADYRIEIDDACIEKERKTATGKFPDSYLETIAAYRIIADRLFDSGTLLFHGAAVAVNGRAYIFLAKSGVGKTTHIRNWIKRIPGVVVINGDKPLIDSDKLLVYGTPWSGKENMNTNTSVPLAGICLLERGLENTIERVQYTDAVADILQFVHKPDAGKETSFKMFDFIYKFKDIPCYRLKCNMNDESAVVAYNCMSTIQIGTGKDKVVEIKNALEKYGKVRCRFNGISMEPLLREDRDFVILESPSSLKVGDVVLFSRFTALVLHRVTEIKEFSGIKEYVIKGDNCSTCDIVCEDRIIGLMTAFERKGKIVTTDDKKYRKYVERILAGNIFSNRLLHKIRNFFFVAGHSKYLMDNPCFAYGQYLYKDSSADTVRSQITEKHKVNRSPKVSVFNNAIILPRKSDCGGVLSEDMKFIPESCEYDFGGFYEPGEILESNETVVYLGRAFPHYGVIMIDLIRRLYYRYLHDCSGYKFACCGIYSEPGTFGKSDRRCWEYLNNLGIDREDVIDVRVPTRFKQVIIPEPGFEYDRYYFDEYYLPFKYASDRVSASKDIVFDNIYLSRRHAGFLKETGERIIEHFFRKNGFYVMYPDEISIEDQIAILKNAKCIASVEGTISHNILFCNKGTEQIVIRKDKRLEPRHFLFNELMNSKVTYIDAYCNYVYGFPRHYDIGPFCMLFNRNLRKFAKDKKFPIPFYWPINNVFVILKYLTLCFKQKNSER